MSTVKEVLRRYHAKVMFPVTAAKIEAAGYDFEEYIDTLIREIAEADDSQDPRVQKLLSAIEAIDMEDY